MLKAAFLYLFLFLCAVAFSRAGSGGSHGGAGGHFGGGGHYYGHSSYGHSGDISPTESRIIAIVFLTAFVVILGYASYLTYLYYFKPAINKKKLKASFDTDPFWDHDGIMTYTNKFYIELQQAWSNGDLLKLRGKLSVRLYRNYMGILNKNRTRGIKNIVEEVEINSTSVIYFDDYLDNSKDAIAILIQGNMKDYYSRSCVKTMEDKKPFKDAYVFIRKNNELILDEIINEPTFYQLAKPSNYIETI